MQITAAGATCIPQHGSDHRCSDALGRFNSKSKNMMDVQGTSKC